MEGDYQLNGEDGAALIKWRTFIGRTNENGLLFLKLLTFIKFGGIGRGEGKFGPLFTIYAEIFGLRI